MTFRGRLVLATTAAVVLVVILGSAAAYVVAYNSLIGSTDTGLEQTAQSIVSLADTNPIPNYCYVTVDQCVQVVTSAGTVNPTDPSVLPITPPVQQVAAAEGNGPPVFSSTAVTINGATVDVREVALPLKPGFAYRSNTQPVVLYQGGALQLTIPLSGVDDELHHLALALAIIGLLGVALAVLFGLGVGRAVLGPLNNLTTTVEELAETTDVSQRLDPGGPDELGRLRRAFNRLLEALDRSRDAQRQLVLDASHELRTPLTSLRTNMEVTRRIDELTPEDREVLVGDVLTQLDELTTVVADLAELARGEQPDRTAGPVRLDSVVEETVAVAVTHGRSRGISFEASIVPCWVLGVRPRIERAVGNLLDNALKWSPDGGVVEVYCRAGTVVVRDHGPGIDPSDLDHLFDRFYRAPSARGLPGSGLGLSIVAQVAREEGGTVVAENAPDGGAVFRFHLPEVTHPVLRDGEPVLPDEG